MSDGDQSWRDFFESRTFYNYEIFAQKLPLRFASRPKGPFDFRPFPPRNEEEEEEEEEEEALSRRRRRRPGTFCWCCCCKIFLLLMVLLALLGLIGGLSYYFSKKGSSGGQFSNSTNETSSQRPNWTTAISLSASTPKTVVPDATIHHSITPTINRNKTTETVATGPRSSSLPPQTPTHLNEVTTLSSVTTLSTRFHFKTYTKPKTIRTTPTSLNPRNVTSVPTNHDSNDRTSEFEPSRTIHTNTEPSFTKPTVDTSEPRTLPPVSELTGPTPGQTTKDSTTHEIETATPDRVSTEGSSEKATAVTSTDPALKTKTLSPQTQHSTDFSTEGRFETGPVTTTAKPKINTLTVKTTARTVDKTLPTTTSGHFQTLTESTLIKTPGYTLGPLTSIPDTTREITDEVISTTGGPYVSSEKVISTTGDTYRSSETVISTTGSSKGYGYSEEPTHVKTSINTFEHRTQDTLFTKLDKTQSYFSTTSIKTIEPPTSNSDPQSGSRSTKLTVSTRDPFDIYTVSKRVTPITDKTFETTSTSDSGSLKPETSLDTFVPHASASTASTNEVKDTPTTTTPKEAERTSETSSPRVLSTDNDVTDKLIEDPDGTTTEHFPRPSSTGSGSEASGSTSTQKTGLTNYQGQSSTLFGLTPTHPTPVTSASTSDQIGLTSKVKESSKIPNTTLKAEIKGTTPPSWITIDSSTSGLTEDFTDQEDSTTGETTLSDGFTDEGGSGMSEDV